MVKPSRTIFFFYTFTLVIYLISWLYSFFLHYPPKPLRQNAALVPSLPAEDDKAQSERPVPGVSSLYP